MSRKGKQERTIATCSKCKQPFVAVVFHTLRDDHGGGKAYHEPYCAACRCLASAESHTRAASHMRVKASEERVRTARAVAKFRAKHGEEGTHCDKCAGGGSCSILSVGA